MMRQLASPAQLRASMLRWALFTVPLVIGLGFFSGSAGGNASENAWFAALARPAIYPPPIAFPVAWSLFYTLMAVALAIIASARGAAGRGIAVAAFVVQFALNLAWSPVFFGMHQMTLALAIIGGMFVTTAITLVLFWRVRPLAGALLIPYLAWICFAGLLNYQFLALNPAADGASGAALRVKI
jgi:translocator protein